MSARVVGNPQVGRLFGQKSRDALTESEQRRSGQFSPPPPPSPPLAQPLPQVIYVPLPSPPRHTVDVGWQDEYMQRARAQCGLPLRSPMLQTWPNAEPGVSSSEGTTTTSTGTTESDPLPPIAWPAKASIWQRFLRAFGCLSGR